MSRYHVTTDPGKPCEKRYRIRARSKPDAVRRAVLRQHDFIDARNIGAIERDPDDGTYTCTVIEADNTPPRHPALARFDWLRVPGVWFWVRCIVKKVRSSPLPPGGKEGHR